MHPLIRFLIQDGPVVTDGGWATELHALGLPVGANPEAWNLACPERVRKVASAYVAAGSRIILTNTFGGNRYIQQQFNLDDQIVEINRQGVRVSREAVQGTGTLVFGSIGPTGKVLPGKEVTAARLREAYDEQAVALAEAGVDGLVIETMTDLEEALVAIAAARPTGLPVVACMTFAVKGDKILTRSGVPAWKVAEKFEEAGADVVGSNCGQGIASFVRVCRQLRQSTRLPIWIKANAGLPRLVDGKLFYAEQPARFAAWVPQLVAAGANFIGGCCGASPAFISAVREVLARSPHPVTGASRNDL